jgi:hypothetical protein
LAIQIAYPNAVGAYRTYLGMNGGYAIENALETGISNAGLELLEASS